jgi:hypothetical protein
MMHHWMPSNNFHQDHMQRTSMGGQQALFCRKFVVACEAREQGHDSKQRHQVEGPIMQAKEWVRELGGATSGARGHESHEGEMIMLEE